MRSPKSARKADLSAGITELALRQLMRTGAVSDIKAVEKRDVYVIEVMIGSSKAQLLNARGGVRTFSSLDTVAKLVESLGAERFDTVLVNTSAPQHSASRARVK